MREKVIELVFVIPGEPVGKARPRVTRTGHAYTPDKTVSYENLVKMSFAKFNPGWKPSNMPARVDIVAEYKIPKSTSKTKHEKMLSGEIKPTKKPDIDNVAKIINDALNGIAWLDDTQVVFETIQKWYSDQPHVRVGIAFYTGEYEE